MNRERRLIYWGAGLAVLLATVHLLGDILWPFVLGFAVAYLLDPVADLLETWHLPRWAASALITVGSVLAVIAVLLLLAPLLQAQLLDFAGRVPDYLELIRGHAMGLLENLRARLSVDDMAQLRSQVGSVAGTDAVAWLGRVVGGLWGSGVALLNLLSLAFITPVMIFYLLRDWDVIVACVESWIPRAAVDDVRVQVTEIDRTLAGFLRGQLMVCALLALFYGIGLSIIGLDFGLIIGFGTGLISFVPYFGMLVGFVVGIGVALAQFDVWLPVAYVAGIFVVGQFIEGNFISPRLVGDRVGLHPMWMIFALMAGGTLFGFTGVLLAVPVAAVLGVLVRFRMARYMASDHYGAGAPSGTDADAGSGPESP